MNNTLVTGGDGLVGYAIRRMALSDTEFLSRSRVDLTNFDLTWQTFKIIKPQRIIHLAAKVGGVGGNMNNSGDYYRNNILINTNVLEAARLVGTQKLISFMSTCVFPEKCSYPLNERDLHNGPPHPSNFGYAYAKRMLEVQSSAYRRQWGSNYIVAIPTNIYGPNDNFSLTDGHVVPSLIHRTYLAKKEGVDLTVWGSGKPLREFVYSADIARLAVWAIDHYQESSPIIFSSGIETSIEELVEIIVRCVGFKGRVIWDKSKPDGQFRKPSDTTKLNKYLPDFQWTSLDEGISSTVEWFFKNYNNIRK